MLGCIVFGSMALLIVGVIMVDFIINLKNGESYHLKTEYKRVSITNKMALYLFI